MTSVNPPIIADLAYCSDGWVEACVEYVCCEDAFMGSGRCY